jgi:hypothetical protein
MTSAGELIHQVERLGGTLLVDGEWLLIRPKEAAAPLLEELRRHKAEIIRILRDRKSAETRAPDKDSLWNWLLEHCVLCDQASSGLGCLHLDFAGWCAARAVPHPGSPDRFREMLHAESFESTEHSMGEVMVLRLILRSDYEAVFGRPEPAHGKLQPDGILVIELEAPSESAPDQIGKGNCGYEHDPGRLQSVSAGLLARAARNSAPHRAPARGRPVARPGLSGPSSSRIANGGDSRREKNLGRRG